MNLIMKSVTVYLALILWVIGSTMAQSYDLNQKPGLDPSVKTGQLPNGMRYYIRANKIPEQRGEFYIATNIGAIQEEDDQNGLAHFTEHMAFNGSKNFPKKSMLDYLATIGVKFGQNVNAGTGVEQTIYNLSNVPLLRESILDSALLVLHDWAHFVSFEPAEIDLERGVILEEWRMYGSASERMDNKLAPIIYQGSKYAKRDIIGDTAVLKHFKYETLTNFYKKWYRPDLQAIVVIGDVDPAIVEAKILQLFSDIPKATNPATKEIYPLPDNKEPLIATASDPEATSTMVEVNFKHPAIPDQDKNLGYMRLLLVRNLINSMFSQRMSDLTRIENPPFISSYSYYGSFTKTREAFTGVTRARNNEAVRALNALLTEIERMRLYGFTEGEFDRAKANLLRNYESRYIDRDKRKNREFVYPMVFNFLVNNPNPGIEFEYQFAKSQIPGITLQEVNVLAKSYITDENMIVSCTGPEQEGITLPSVTEIREVVNTYKSQKIDPYIDNMSGKKLIENEPLAGKVLKTSDNKSFGTTEWVLSNGMKVVFKPTDIKEDELMIRAYSPGGLSLVEDADIPVANMLGSMVSEMGVGSFSKTDLNKFLSGKRVNIMLGLTYDQDYLLTRTSPKDLETALQLMYLAFTRPRWDETDYKTWFDKVKSEYINADAEPRKAFRDSINVMMNNHSKRNIPMSYQILDHLSFDKFKKLYSHRYADPANFTVMLVGKIDPETVKPIIEKYLASLPTATFTETVRDDGVRPPQGKVTNDFQRENKTPRTSVFVNYNGKSPFTADDRLLGAAMRHCLELRYIESIREDEGGTYSVRVSYVISKYPVENSNMNVIFDTDPVKADKLIGIVHREAKKMIESGPGESDLQKAREYFLKQRQEDLKENNWWSSILLDYYFYNMDYLSSYEEKVKALDVRAVHEYARKALDQGNIIEVVMRP
ncbi:MAG: M16 family metallopeptidase [Bacteroidales bacterium]